MGRELKVSLDERGLAIAEALNDLRAAIMQRIDGADFADDHIDDLTELVVDIVALEIRLRTLNRITLGEG